MNNYKLTIQYDGTNYAGWQIQNNADTVQSRIKEAIGVITKEEVNLIGSGRTDAGVHAFGQVANFRSKMELDFYKFRYSLNSILPNDISVINIEKVPAGFHARFDAKWRSYFYFLSHDKLPFYDKYSYRYPPIKKIEIDKLNRLSESILGGHDFTSFARKSDEPHDKSCCVLDACWRRERDLTYFYIRANRFLHGMVRTIVGTIIFAAENNLSNDYLLDVITKRERSAAAEALPAKGLFLFKVRY